jgi:cob(I)alamin adenosyltransferase
MALGKVDSLNAQLGMLLAEALVRQGYVRTEQWLFLASIQNALFNLGAELVTGNSYLTEEDLEVLEVESEGINLTLPPLTEFVLPRGSEAVCQAHICRTTAREAECLLVAAGDAVSPLILRYINRLSDYFFNLARFYSDVSRECVWTKAMVGVSALEKDQS